MKSTFLVVGLIAGVLGAISWNWAPDTYAENEVVIEADRVRLLKHFDRVQSVLKRADVSHLSQTQQNRRSEALGFLKRYAATEIFPHNHVLPGSATPVFEDEHGTLCAMAYLIAESGSRDVVDAVSNRFNTGYVAELAEDEVLGRPLIGWLEENGITAREAAMIQPSYNWNPNPTPNCVQGCILTDYAVASAGLGLVELGATLVNSNVVGSDATRAWVGPVGVGLGGAGIALGALKFPDGGDVRILGVANMAVGAVTAAFGLKSLLSSKAAVGARSIGRVSPVIRSTSDGRRILGVRLVF